jgi:hypothetical protein
MKWLANGLEDAFPTILSGAESIEGAISLDRSGVGSSGVQGF